MTLNFKHSGNRLSEARQHARTDGHLQQLPSIKPLLNDIPRNASNRVLFGNSFPQQDIHRHAARGSIPDILRAPPTPDTLTPLSTPTASPSPMLDHGSHNEHHPYDALCSSCRMPMNDAKHVKMVKEQKSREREQTFRRDCEDLLIVLADFAGAKKQTRGNGHLSGLQYDKGDIDRAGKRILQFLLDREFKAFASRGDLEGFRSLIRHAHASDPLVQFPDDDRCCKGRQCRKGQGVSTESRCTTHGHDDWRECHIQRRDLKAAKNIIRWCQKNHLPAPIEDMELFARIDPKQLDALLREAPRRSSMHADVVARKRRQVMKARALLSEAEMELDYALGAAI